jgi:ATP-dependent Clp protease ATP-binding subunit ClpC
MEKASRGEIKPAIGRETEIKRIIQILSLYTKNNPVLIGDAGTGKTAIVEGLVFQLLEGNVPAELANLYIYQLDPSSINGEDTLRSIIDEAKSEPRIVLFIDEIHTLIGKGAYSNNSFANILKPEMARGTIKILGATTNDEYTQHIEKDKAFERRFQKVQIDEPSVESSIIILSGIKNRFEQHHNVRISQEAIESAVKLSHRFITDRRLPDKAIDLLDEASSNVHLKGGNKIVTDKDIMEVVTRRTGIPMQNLTPEDITQLKNIESTLHNSVVGQEKAVRAVANAIRRSRMGLGDEARPIGSFLFLGTSGVGKTELCKALADTLFHSRDAMVRIDMSEYQLEHSVARLFGAPPGYIGYEQGGQLTEAVRKKPYSVVLFDEMEKAHPKVFETLLQVLDDGRMTDGQGRTINFRNTIIVMTSNMGQRIIAQNLSGDNISDHDIERTTSEVVALLKQRAAPEFWGRVDNVVMFLPLTRKEVLLITQMQLRASQKRMENQGITIAFDDAIAEFIARNSYQPEYGARQVKKVINRLIIDKLATSLAEGTIKKSQPIICSLVGEKIVCYNR